MAFLNVSACASEVIRWKLAEMARQIEATHAWIEIITHQMNTMQPMEAFIKLGGSTALLKVQCTKARRSAFFQNRTETLQMI